MKQPLKEMLKKIGGGHLLTENTDIDDYSHELGEYLNSMRIPQIKGWRFSIDIHSGAYVWDHAKFEESIYATWGWEGKNEIPVETSDGESFKTIKLKLKPKESLESKLDIKKDVKKYISAMKKELPKIEKKLLNY